MSDVSEQLQQQVHAAYDNATPLCIQGGNSKAFYGRACTAETLSVREHSGIVNYAPTELVITARSGTRLSDIETALAEQNQMLAFEPPHYGEHASIGGTVACNFSGPRRAYAGAARDFVLGCKIINGKGELLAFGGEVMKNVAGYDVSRLMAGAMGTLGVITEVSLKVLPKPESEITLALESNASQALQYMHQWSRTPMPVSATCFDGDRLFVRLGSSEDGVHAAHARIGGEIIAEQVGFWKKLREQKHAFFISTKSLWRLSVESNAEPLKLDARCLYEWGGALRWYLTDAATSNVRALAASTGGHATLFRGTGDDRFHPLDAGVIRMHQKLKAAFDPKGILNPGRMYAEVN